MAGPKKTPLEKIETKTNSIIAHNPNLSLNDRKIKIDNNLLFSYNSRTITFTKRRYYPTRLEPLIEEDFKVAIPLNHENLTFVSRSSIKPPNFTKNLIRLFRDITGIQINTIIIGSSKNSIEGVKLHITKEVYDDFNKINREEGKEQRIRFKNRVAPFLDQKYNLQIDQSDNEKDYSLLLREVINSGQVSQEDILKLTGQLETGEVTNVVIKKQINKQVKWLIESIEKILDEDELLVPKAKELGNKHFGYSKLSIKGPEQLMEKILTQYGQNAIFGVPALLNTDKYVIHAGELSKSQFDILLINHLGDIELVELKRPDKFLLEYNSGRAKFFASADLSMGISQCERYISTVTKDNDEELLINGKKIREFLNDEIGGVMHVESVRPSALIVMGSSKTLFKSYDNLSASKKAKVTREKYNKNGERAYLELKNSFKNIKIVTYSELMESARTRLELSKDENENQDPEDEQIVA